MCIATRIEEKLAKKAALDAEIAKLEKIENQKSPVLALLREILNDIEQEAPEELSSVWQEVLAIGSHYNLAVQPITAEELRQWEVVNADNEKLKTQLGRTKDQYLELLETSANRVKELQAELEAQRTYLEEERAGSHAEFEDYKQNWQAELETERAARLAVEKDLEEVRSQFAQMQRTYSNPNPSPNLTPEESAEVAEQLTDFAKELRRQNTESEIPDVVVLGEAVTQEKEHPVQEEEELALDEGDEDVVDTGTGIYSSIVAITLWQPWASLVAQGDKKIETRSWSTSYRGPIAIHAAKRSPDWSTFSEDSYALPEGKDWPQGAVVAIANLVDCVEMTPEFIAAQSQEERALGLWQPGRFAWVLENVRPLDPPVPAKGGQKLWQWNGAVTKCAAEPEDEAGETYDPLALDNETEVAEAEINWKEWDSKFKSSDNQWDIWQKNKKDGGILLLFQKKDEGFTETITKEEWEKAKAAHNVWTKRGVLGDYSEELLQRRLKTATEKPTELQKLLEGTNNYIFEKLGARVKIDSEFIENNHREEPEVIEEALFTVTDLGGGKVQHYYHSAEDLTRRKPIAGWNPLGNLMNTAEDYAKKWVKEQFSKSKVDAKVVQSEEKAPIAEMTDQVSAEPETETRFKLMGYSVQVYPQPPMGATFRFLDAEGTVKFTNSPLLSEMGDRPYKEIAQQLVKDYEAKQAAERDRIANPHKKPEDEFLRMEKLSNSVGYLARRDTGEIIASYVGFSNFDEEGNKTTTYAKARARNWAEYLRKNNEASEEGKVITWSCSEPRKVKRLSSDNPKQPFVQELKLTGVGKEYLQRLTQLDFCLQPPKQQTTSKPKSTVTAPSEENSKAYTVIVNDHWLASGTEAEMRSRFQEELKLLGGDCMSIALVTGGLVTGTAEILEEFCVNDFTFIPTEDFDPAKPEYEVTHPTLPGQIFTVWKKSLPGQNLATWRNSVYPYDNSCPNREGAVADAVRRSLKAQQVKD